MTTGRPSGSCLELCDVLVDGPFILEQRSLALKWRGSHNQRVIDVPKSLATGEVILYNDNNYDINIQF
jgi:anaerobic ribonucleoside-triphosphate reductase activating protein